MGRKEEIVDRVRSVAAPVVVAEGMELVDVELAGSLSRPVLRLYIDRPGGGVSLDDCTLVSRAVSAALDVEDPVESSYDLEVSSPGLDRPLRTPEHFRKFAGQRVRLKAFGPIAECDNRKNFVGELRGYEDGRIVVDVEGREFKVPHEKVSKANVVPTIE